MKLMRIRNPAAGGRRLAHPWRRLRPRRRREDGAGRHGQRQYRPGASQRRRSDRYVHIVSIDSNV
jgi:hypothetical protein